MAAKGGLNLRVRSLPEVRRFFDDLELIEPGVRVATRWRPEPGDVLADDAAVPLCGES